MNSLRPLWERLLCLLLTALMAVPGNVVVAIAQSTASRIIVNDGSASRSVVTNLAVELTTGEIPTPERFTVYQQPYGPQLSPTNFHLLSLGESNTLRLGFTNLPGNRLPDGNYLVSVVGASGTNAEGSRRIEAHSIHSLFGDRDGDRDVDFFDTFGFRSTWLSDGGPRFDSQFDADGDGIVGLGDLPAFRENYFTTLPECAGVIAEVIAANLPAAVDHSTAVIVAGVAYRTNGAAQIRAGMAAGGVGLSSRTEILPTDLTGEVSDRGDFTLTGEQLGLMLGRALSQGSYVLSLQILEEGGFISAAFDLPFAVGGPCAIPDLALWEGTSEPTPGVPGSAGVEGCELFLREGDSFQVSLRRAYQVPPGAVTLDVTFLRPAFASGSSNRMGDAFEVALLAPAGGPLTFNFRGRLAVASPSGEGAGSLPPIPDAFYNLTERWESLVGPETASREDGELITVSLDVRSLGGQVGDLVLRLINNDGDRGGEVRITRVAFSSGEPPSFARGSGFGPSKAANGLSLNSVAAAGPRGTGIVRSLAREPEAVRAVRGTAASAFGFFTNIVGSLDAFNALAGSPPVMVCFDHYAPGTDLTDQVISGVRFSAPGLGAPAAPLVVVRSSETETPPDYGNPLIHRLLSTSGEMLLSPGGNLLGPGPNGIVENDDLQMTFEKPVSAVGFDIAFQSYDCCSYTRVSVLSPSGETLFSVDPLPLPSGIGNGFTNATVFVGFVSESENIAQVVIDEYDDNANPPDSNIGFDSIRFAGSWAESLVGPSLTILEPEDRKSVPPGKMLITGIALAQQGDNPRCDLLLAEGGDPGAKANLELVTLNDVAVSVDAAGNFFQEVEIRPGRNTFTAVAIDSSGLSASNSITVIGGPKSVQQSELGVVSQSIRPEYTWTGVNEETGILYAGLRLRNVGTYGVSAPFLLGVRALSEPDIQVLGMDGQSGEGIAYYNIDGSIEVGRLEPGEVSTEVHLAFGNVLGRQFTYEVVLLGRLNAAPEFVSTPTLSAMVGRPYRYPSHAQDADNDPLTYGIAGAPEGLSIEANGGAVSWTPSGDQLGNHEVQITALDPHGARALQRFQITVTPVLSNRPPVFVSTPVTVARISTIQNSVPQPVDLQNWEAVQIIDGFQPKASWVLSESNTVVTQVLNADPSLYVSPVVFSDAVINGTWNTIDEDDDLMGFAFGYQDPQHFYLFDWKKSPQDHRGLALAGMSVKIVHADSPLNGYDLWPTAGSPGRVTTLYHNSVPWHQNNDYTFTLKTRPGVFEIQVRLGTNVLDTIAISDSTYPAGKFAFYNYSQGRVRYTGFTQAAIPVGGYEYLSKAIDADGDTLRYQLVTGPTNCLVNAVTGFIQWALTAEKLGEHSVVIKVEDGRGGEAFQSYLICVLPADGNRPPQFTTRPPTGRCYPSQVQGSQRNTLVPYLSTGYRYRIVSSGEDLDFFRLDYVDTDFLTGDAGFGSGSCDLNDLQFTRTAWPANTDLLIRRVLPLTDRATSLKIKVAIDNDIEVFVNGQDVSIGRQFHDGCPSRDSFIFDVPASYLVAGDNLIAVRAVDRGTWAYFDMEVESEEAPALIQYVAQAVDPDGDSVRYRVEGAPVGMSMDPVSGLVAWRTNRATPGDYPVKLVAEDGRGGSASQNFVLSVSNGCQPAVRGIVWNDLNTNGIRDAFSLTIEPGLGSQIVFADLDLDGRRGALEPHADTASSGFFELWDLPVGAYQLRVEARRGWSVSAPGGNESISVEVTSSETAPVSGFGLVQVPYGRENADPVFGSMPGVTTAPFADYEYRAYATDVDGDQLEYDLVIAPVGMLVEATTGVVVWRPTSEQAGVHDVNLRVRDQYGGVALQTFSLSVSQPNTPPVLLSSLPASSIVDRSYTLQLVADDAEGHLVLFGVIQPPSGFELNETNGILAWTPTLEQVGTNLIEITVTDSEGASSSKSFPVVVRPSGANNPPVFVTTPRLQTRFGMPWVFLARTTDPDADLVVITLTSGPNEMFLTNQIAGFDGILRKSPLNSLFLMWTPPAEVIGSTNVVELKADDVHGGVATQRFQIVVGNTLDNSTPAIVSTPPRAATAGETYEYDLVAEDADGDLLSWRLVHGPEGTSLNAETGTLRWTPTLDQLGTKEYIVEVSDGLLGFATQDFSVEVGCVNRPPSIVSIPPVSTAKGSLFLYAARAADPDEDPLAWSLVGVEPLAEISVDSATGLVRWTVPEDAAPSYLVRVRASDGRGGSDTQSFTLYVGDERANKPPVITSSPSRGISAGRDYIYGVTATDPDGDLITLQLLEPSPNGAILDSDPPSPGRSSAVLRWTPGLEVIGSQNFIIAARDPSGASAGQRFSVQVRPNQPPRITSVARTNAVPSSFYRYDIFAVDADSDPLAYRLATAPAGMTVDTFGRIQWQPSGRSLGTVPVEIEVSDGFGGLALQAFEVSVVADTEPPKVALSPGSGVLTRGPGGWSAKLGTSVQLQVLARDNVGVVEAGLRIGADSYPLNASGVAVVPVLQAGPVEAVAFAVDGSGNMGTNSHTIQFLDPNAPDSLFVGILSPTNGAVITKRQPIVATITNSTPIAFYQVDYAPAAEIDLNDVSAGGNVWRPLSRVDFDAAVRTNALNAITVATFDPLALINDNYVVRVYAGDEFGGGWYEPIVVGVEGNLRFGEFQIAFNDLTIPLAGMPITVSRVYDSRLSSRSGDFGYGWNLGVQDAMIRVASRDGVVRPGARVYLNGPDGRRLGFTTDIQVTGGGFFFATTRMFFRPDAGVFDRLEADGLDDVYLGQTSFGEALGGEPTLGIARLITRDGTRYEYSRTGGLQSVTDTSGNVLRYTKDGVFHYPAGSETSDQSILFVRDARGRIERIVPPQGPPLVYTYDAVGDLRTFSDLGENITQYAYDSVRAHFLTNIVDPFGKGALGLVYENGALKEVRDAAGNPITQDFDSDENTGTFTDARGTQTIVHFDDRGNETARIIPGLSTNSFAYDENNNLTNAVNANGYATNFVYDARGNVTRITDALTNVTEIAYNELGKPTAVTNALGQVLRLQYSPAGHLTEVINNLGFTTRVGRDAQGRVTNLVDAVGNTNSFVYDGGCSCGRPGLVFNPDGSFRRYEYDAYGRTNLVVNELGATTRLNHAPDGRLLWVEDALTNRTTYLYDGTRLTNIVDALRRSTQFRYDEFGRTNQIITAEGGTNEFRYDENGNRTHVIDAVGNVTRFVYDAANRVTNRIDTFGRTNHFVLNAMGNEIETIDRNGRRRTFAYDALGRMTNEVWWEGSEVVKSITFGFNELGVQTLAADDVARYDYRFDALNRLERVIQAAASGQAEFTLFYTYTAHGQIESVTDNWGVTVGSKYDNRNRLEQRTWQGPGVDPARAEFGYDPSGSRIRTDRYADLEGGRRIGFTTNAYNLAGVVTNITHLGPAGEELARYDYDFDAAWQIRQWTINHEASTFDYDQTGQLTNAVNSAAGLPDENFRYDANGNRVGVQSGGTYVTNLNNQILSDGTNTYAYDFEGNMASRSNTLTGGLTTYQWDHRNRLTTVLDHNPGGVVTQTVTFEYDAMNRRLAKSVNGQTTHFLYNGDDSWADLDGSNAVTARYLHGVRIDELLARQRITDGRGWYLTDHLGTVRDIANAAGGVVAHVDYSSFGQVLGVSNPTITDRFMFTARELDRETGLYFYRARYYLAQFGRFISNDPIGFKASESNLYRYVNNSPQLASDPSGHVVLFVYAFRAAYIGAAYGTIKYSLCSILYGTPFNVEGLAEAQISGAKVGVIIYLFLVLYEATGWVGAAGPFPGPPPPTYFGIWKFLSVEAALAGCWYKSTQQ